MFPLSPASRKSRHLAIAAACTVALALGVVVPALATSQAGPLYVYDTADAYAIEGYTTANNGIGVEGYAALASATGMTGVLGYTSSQYSTGVTGYSDGTGTSYGVYGYSANGNGLYAKSLSSSAASIYGLNANNGTAIYGYSNGLGLYGISTLTNGIVGTTQTTDNSQTGNHYAGVLGTDSSTAGSHYGVAGTTGSTNGYGVYGLSTGTGYTYGTGIAGKSSGTGPGVYGTSSGQGSGVVGVTSGSSQPGYGNGVAGSSNSNDGVLGQTITGTGVFGIANGNAGTGVQGEADGPNGRGVLAYSGNASAVALRVISYGGTPIAVQTGSLGEIMSLDANGSMILRGTLTQNGSPLSVVRNPQGTARVAYASRQTQPTIEDVGEAQLVGGRAYVRLDPAFAEMLDRSASYYVFITPEADSAGVFVSQKSAGGFAVRENGNARSTLAFQYRIVARPALERSFARLALYRDSLAILRGDKSYGVRANRANGSSREIRSRGVTVGRLPQRLKAPFVPKPELRR